MYSTCRRMIGVVLLALLLPLLIWHANAGTPVLDFSHGSARVAMNESYPGLTNLTLEVWIQASVVPVANSYGSIAGRGYLQDANGFGLFTHHNGDLVFQTRTGGTTVSASAPYSFDGQWWHLAGVRKGNYTILYIDGQEVDRVSGALSSLDQNDIVFALGARDSGTWGFYFDGSMADVRLWDIARDQAQIQATMYQRLSGEEAGLIGYWPLDEGEGTTVFDATSAGHDGGIVNASWVSDDDITLGFVVRNPLTGSLRYTAMNDVDVIGFSLYAGYDLYQIAENGQPPVDDPAEWLSTNTPPTDYSFAVPSTDTNVLLTVWYTNSTTSVALNSNTAEIIYVTVSPDVSIHAERFFVLVEGETVVEIEFAQLDTGTTGGDYDGETIPLFGYSLSCVDDVTPSEPFVTLDAAGDYEIVVTVTNAAGSVASATSQVAVAVRTEPHLYVSLTGDNTTGMSWSNAYTSLPTALENAVAGDTIHLAGQTFAGSPASGSATVFLLQNVTNLTLRGGYQADPDLAAGEHPGSNDPDQWPTVLSRTSGDARVLSLIGVSTVRIERVTISNGNILTADSNLGRGGGVHVNQGNDVVFSECRITGNNARRDGAGMYLIGSTVTLTNCVVADNYAYGYHNADNYAGGVFVNGTSRLTVRDSMIRKNHCRSGANGNAFGGGFYVAPGGVLDVRETMLIANRTSVERAYNTVGGAIDNRGTLYLANSLVVSNESSTLHSGGIFSGGGSAAIVNCTVADNQAVGIRHGVGTIVLTNSIVWGHTVDLMNFPEDGGVLPGVWYSNIGDGQNAGQQGCLSVNPLFADRITYHLQSTEGHYTNGYFSGGFWTNAAANSPLIDRGDPAADFNREPIPNGGRVNMGAYGNTPVAAKTAEIEVDPPVATNLGAQAWGHRTAILRGEIVDDGGEFSEAVFHYWIVGDSVTNNVPMGVRLEGEPFEHSAVGLTPGAAYLYRVSAINSEATTYSAALPFVMHPTPSALYVATNGNHTAGTNWSTAYRDLQTALNIVEDGDTVYLADDTFEDSPGFGLGYVFILQDVNDIALRGGYLALDDTDLPGTRDVDQASTVITRTSGNVRVMNLISVSNAVFEGLTIRNGYHTSANGGGIYLSGSRDIVFTECRIIENLSYRDGAGLFLANSTATLIDSLLANNIQIGGGNVTRYGGGAHVNGTSRLSVSNSLIRANRAHGSNNGHGQGGGFYVAPGGVLDIRNSVLNANHASRDRVDYAGVGGAIDNRGTLIAYNNLVVSNASNNAHSDGIFSGGGGLADIVNCTVVDNGTVGVRYGSGTLSLTNTIVWGHTATNLMNFPTDGAGGFLNVSHSLADAPEMDGFNDCVRGDPRFIDAATGNYRLQNAYGAGDPALTSPAVDAGINLPWMSSAVDLDGRDRIMKGLIAGSAVRVDMGAYEALPPSGTLFLFR